MVHRTAAAPGLYRGVVLSADTRDGIGVDDERVARAAEALDATILVAVGLAVAVPLEGDDIASEGAVVARRAATTSLLERWLAHPSAPQQRDWVVPPRSGAARLIDGHPGASVVVRAPVGQLDVQAAAAAAQDLGAHFFSATTFLVEHAHPVVVRTIDERAGGLAEIRWWEGSGTLTVVEGIDKVVFRRIEGALRTADIEAEHVGIDLWFDPAQCIPAP